MFCSLGMDRHRSAAQPEKQRGWRVTGSSAVYPSGQVTLREVGLRDGLQLVNYVRFTAKRDWLDAEHQAGSRHFEIVGLCPRNVFRNLPTSHP